MTFLLLIPLVFANGVGNEVRKESGNYYVEFGIDPKESIANELTTMSFSIHQKDGIPIATDNVWLRISKGNDILVSSSNFRITTEGPMYFTYAFPKKGNYEIEISTKINNENVKANFDVNIEGINYLFVYLTIALFVGIIIGYFLKKKNYL